MLNEPPPIPEIPKIPRGRLWLCLLGPLASVILWVVVVFLFSRSGAQFNGFMTFMGYLAFGGCLASLIGFIQLISRRYTSRNVVLMVFGYLIGQVVLLLAVGLGACFRIAAS